MFGIITAVFLAVEIGFALFIFFLSLAFVTGAPFVPSTDETADAMIRLAAIRRGTKIYDLGSGDGKLLFRAARAGGTAVGYEINPLLVFWTWIRILVSPDRSRTRVRWKNFWHAGLPGADIVFVYLLPWRMEKLEGYLRKTLKPGTRIVSNSFIFPNLNKITEDQKNHVYVFRV
ncbi:hypothetical protein M1555_02910 [Patescibacteria group bacterium]|nr:hypothetical protein [Patescibacteria group bacterium]